MKRTLSIILCVILALCTVACGGDVEMDNTNTSLTESTVNSEVSSVESTTSVITSSEAVSSLIKPGAKPVIPDGDTYTENGKTYVREYAANIELFKYCGTWQADFDNSKAMVSYWNVAYFEIDFTGNSIVLEFLKPSDFYAIIDNTSEMQLSLVNGKRTFNASGDGKHTLKIFSSSARSSIYFLSAAVPKGQKMSRTADKEHYIQFIGDSISEDGRSFTFHSAKMLNWDYSVTAKGGMSLRTGYGYYLCDFFNHKLGMEDAFFRLGYPHNDMTGLQRDLYSQYLNIDLLKNNFQTGNTPDIVFIFIGTNDGLTETYFANDFAKRYLAFVDNIMSVYENKPQIVMMQALSATYPARFECFSAAADAVLKKYPGKAYFIDKATVDSWGVEINQSDNVHPTANGYARLSDKIAEWLGAMF